MDHSTRAYLKRLSGEKLEHLLQECLQEDGLSCYGMSLLDILEESAERAEKGSLFLSPYVRALLEERWGQRCDGWEES